MSRLDAANKLVALALAGAYLALMARYLYVANPALRERVRFWFHRAPRVARWRVMYPHLPAWAQEAAQVRGLAPPAAEQESIDLSRYS